MRGGRAADQPFQVADRDGQLRQEPGDARRRAATPSIARFLPPPIQSCTSKQPPLGPVRHTPREGLGRRRDCWCLVDSRW